MYVVTVVFEIHDQHVERFHAAMLRQAEASLQREQGCQQFDVAVEPGAPGVFYLYELYTNRAAFDAHLASEHFLHFDRTVTPWVRFKTVKLLERIWPASAEA